MLLLEFLMNCLLVLVVVFVCDHTPWYITWLAVLQRVGQDDEMKR